MADFQTSTHRSKWIFTEQNLAEKRAAANQRAVELLEKCGVTRLEVDCNGSVSFPQPLNELKNKRHSLTKTLNCDEEQFMRVIYEQKIREVCEDLCFPHKIQGTAILYFKRFYLQWSVMEHHPKNILLVCIYSSCKIEENYISAELLGRVTNENYETILNYEMAVIQNLGFDLIVYSPYRSIEGFVYDMQEFSRARDDELEIFKNLKEKALSEVDEIMLTDAPLLFPPGQLALAGLRRSNEVHRVLNFERYTEHLISRQQSAHTDLELNESMETIDYLVGKFHKPSGAEMRPIERKRRSCWDPNENKKREKQSKHKSNNAAGEMQRAPAES